MEIVELAVLIKVAQTMGTHACISSTYMYLKSLTIFKNCVGQQFYFKGSKLVWSKKTINKFLKI